MRHVQVNSIVNLSLLLTWHSRPISYYFDCLIELIGPTHSDIGSTVDHGKEI